jgi:type I restriction enzyme S subunit
MVSSTGHGDASLKRIHYQDGQYAVGTILAVVRVRDKNRWSDRFIYEYLSAFKDEQLVSRMVGTANVSLTLGKLKDVSIPELPIDVQRNVERLMQVCDQLESKLSIDSELHEKLVQALLDSLTQASYAQDFATHWQRLSAHFDTLFTTESSIDALKKTLLQLAVMGKLVPQDESDGSASEMLNAIADEKRKLEAEGSFKNIRHAKYIPEREAFDLPENWSWAGADDLTLLITDGTHHTPTYIAHGVPFISVKDIDGKTVSFDHCKYISEEEHTAINTRCNPEQGDILLCRIGTLGRPTIVDTATAFSVFVSVGLLKLPKTLDLSRYLHLALSSPLLYRQFDQIKAGGSHTSKLNLGDIPRLRIPLPPTAEQHRIVAKVDQLMALCDQLKTRLRQARDLNQQLATTLVERAVA